MINKLMKPQDLQLRCLAHLERDGSWFAICIDLNLAVQGHSFNEVKGKLHAMTYQYLKEALTEDERYFSDLVPRKAPLIYLAQYHLLSLFKKMNNFANNAKSILFTEHLPIALKA